MTKQPADNEKEAAKPSVMAVRVRLMDGSELQGTLPGFSPLWRRLTLTLPAVDGAVSETRLLDTEDVVYIAFHRSGGHPARQPHLAGLKEVRVKTVTDEDFEVLVVQGQQYPQGFNAFTDEDDTAFERIFFYLHGVNSRELMQPIGEVLVNEKLISREEVEQGLKAQEEGQGKPIGEILVENRKLKPEQLNEALLQQKGKKRMQLGAILMEAGMINEDELEQALQEQARHRNLKLGQVLLKMGILSEDELTSALALKFHLPVVDLDEYPIDPLATSEVDDELIRKYQWLPVQADDTNLVVALADPLAMDAFAAISFQTKRRITQVLATPSQLARHIDELLGKDIETGNWLMMEQIRDAEEGAGDEIDTDEELQAAEKGPVVKLVNKIILDGLHKGASDIHLLPQAKGLVLAYRINGELREELTLEHWVQRRVVSRIKIVAGMDISERRLPQDGRLMIRHEGKRAELRISCIPNVHGESVVMRVLEKEKTPSLASLGLREEDSKRLGRMVRKPFGLILATGPTGSGKSTTLFALLGSIIDRPVHIITVEDPVESDIPGADQVQVNSKIGLTFARVLRNVLRHDPDVIMVGEMRDEETARIGIEASLTGHLMLSTLHTNTAVDTIVRLQDLDIPTYLLAPALLGVLSQNLVRQLCPHCREALSEEDESYAVLRDLGHESPPTLYRSKGCDQCGDTGYIGRLMVYEFLEVGDAVRQAIHDGLVGQDLQRVAVEAGMRPKGEHALELAARGEIGRDDLLGLLM
jgi:type II secretory ATPase GspE/PulE/Tfp pilus assembly ATPase PilB-like protein